MFFSFLRAKPSSRRRFSHRPKPFLRRCSPSPAGAFARPSGRQGAAPGTASSQRISKQIYEIPAKTVLRTPSELHLHPHFLPPPAPRPLRHTPIHSEAPFSGNTRPVQPASLACTPSTPSGAPASSARNPPTSLTSSRYPASSLLPDAAETPLRPLPANAATFVSSSCRNHTPTRPRPRRLSCRLPHHRPPRSSPPTGWPANAPSVAFPPPALLCVAILSPAAFRRHHRRLPLLPPSPAPHLPATAPPPHPLLSKKEEPTRPLFPTKSLSLQNMDGPPAKNARKRGLLPAPFRIFAHLYPRHARKTG